MTQAVVQILNEIDELSADERAELTDRLVESLARSVSPEIEQAQLAEVQRRVFEVEAEGAALIPGQQALAQVRRMVEEAGRTK